MKIQYLQRSLEWGSVFWRALDPATKPCRRDDEQIEGQSDCRTTASGLRKWPAYCFRIVK